MKFAGSLPDNGKIKNLPRRSIDWIVRPFMLSASFAADGFFTVLAQVMLALEIVEPVNPARMRFRRVFSTSGSSGMIRLSSVDWCSHSIG